jgi:hypothetical protein
VEKAADRAAMAKERRIEVNFIAIKNRMKDAGYPE